VLPAFQADRHKFMSAGMQPSALSQCKISASQMPGVVICLCTFLQFGSDVRDRLFNNSLSNFCCLSEDYPVHVTQM